MESSSLRELEQIPGVGKTIAQDIGRISASILLSILRASKLSSFMIDSASLRPLQPALSLVEWVEGAAEESIKTKAGFAGLKWLYTKYYRLTTN